MLMKTKPVTVIFKENKTYGCWAIEDIDYQQMIYSDERLALEMSGFSLLLW